MAYFFKYTTQLICVALMLIVVTIPGMEPYRCCENGFGHTKFLGGAEGFGLLCTEQETWNCDDTVKQVGVPQLLFKSLLICALVNHKNGGLTVNGYKSGNSCLKLAYKVSHNIIDASQNPVMITHKDLIHRLLPFIKWPHYGHQTRPIDFFELDLGHVAAELNPFKMNGPNLLWVGFCPCIHNVNSVWFGEVALTMQYQFEENRVAIEEQFKNLVPSNPRLLVDLCAREVAKKFKDEKFNEHIEKLPPELYERVLQHVS